MSLIATERPTGYLRGDGVGGDRQLGAGGEAIDGRDQPLGLVLGRYRRRAARRHGTDVEHLEPRLRQGHAVLDRALGSSTPRSLEHRVLGDVDDAHADGPV